MRKCAHKKAMARREFYDMSWCNGIRAQTHAQTPAPIRQMYISGAPLTGRIYAFE